MVVQSDNLTYMQNLPAGEVDLLYSDILYGTGNDFKDYKDITNDKKVVFEFYSERIKEMHRIISPTGSLYLQCDFRICHFIRIILEDTGFIFRNQIAWKRRSNSQNSLKKGYTNNHDVILYYTKHKQDFTFNNQFTPLSAETHKRFNLTDTDGRKYQWQGIKKTGYNKVRTLIFEGKEYTEEYAWTQETLNKFLQNGGKIKVNQLGDLCYQIFLDNSKGVQISDFWEDIQNENTAEFYETQKSLELMARIIKTSSNEGDLLVDVFAGSGSFLVAGKRLNRIVKGCDISKKAVAVSNKRLQLETNLFNTI